MGIDMPSGYARSSTASKMRAWYHACRSKEDKAKGCGALLIVFHAGHQLLNFCTVFYSDTTGLAANFGPCNTEQPTAQYAQPRSIPMECERFGEMLLVRGVKMGKEHARASISCSQGNGSMSAVNQCDGLPLPCAGVPLRLVLSVPMITFMTYHDGTMACASSLRYCCGIVRNAILDEGDLFQPKVKVVGQGGLACARQVLRFINGCDNENGVHDKSTQPSAPMLLGAKTRSAEEQRMCGEPLVREGYLLVRTGVRAQWPMRFVVLANDGLLLYKNHDSLSPINTFIPSAVIASEPSRGAGGNYDMRIDCELVKTDLCAKCVIHARARSAEERGNWISDLTSWIDLRRMVAPSH
eukprot:SAG11_NODE_2903_length_2848_cov_1.596944_1_plen_353_part_10